MNVAGLNNLGFQAAASKSGGTKSMQQGKGKSSFESILGQTQATHTESSQAPRETDTQEQNTEQESQFEQQQPPAQPQAQAQVANETPRAREESSSDALPTGAGAPSFSGPGLTDRMPTAPINNAGPLAMVNQQPASPLPDEATNSLTRRVVWNDFLRKMNDIGVSAEDVLHAFGSLNEKDLALPPEQTVDKVVMALGLDGQQAALAKQYFTELINKTKTKSFAEELSAPNKTVSLQLMTQKELQRRNLQKSVDHMQRDFFMPKPLARPVIPQEAPTQVDAQTLAKPMANAQALNTQNDDGDESLGRAAEMLRPQGTIPGVNPQASHAANPAQINNLIAQMQQDADNASTPEEKKSIEQLIKNFTHQNSKATPDLTTQPMAAAPMMAAAQLQMTPNPQMPVVAAPAFNGMLGGRGKSHNSGDDSSTGDDGTQDLSQMNSALAPDQRFGADTQNVKGDFQSQMAKTNGQPQPMAVPDLVQQAHVMVHDGGGEMKVTLHPDGLGDVAMRVSVHDGKVSVQMITESDEAKKLIERQIGDLKTGLAQNHLQVDSIKIDTATNLGKQLEQQYQDAQRQQMQAAMEQFRQDTGGWRRSFFEPGVVNPYHRQGEAPRDVQAPTSTASARARSNSSRRLDLVA